MELRPVSEGEWKTNLNLRRSSNIFQEFADPPLLHIRDIKIEEEGEKKDWASSLVEPSENPPKSLLEWAVLILNTPNPKLKVSTPRILNSIACLSLSPYHPSYHLYITYQF